MNKEVSILMQKGQILPLMEQFYTIQGEGSHTGTAAYFIRIGGCDVGCHWCDVKESWDAVLHPPTTIDRIVEKVDRYATTVVVTGGEPLMWNMDPLTHKLKQKNMKIHIETSGAYTLSGVWDWICLSPKKNKLPTKSVYDSANELKVIIHNKHDFLFAEEQAVKVNQNAILFLQPEWGVKDKMISLIVDYVMNNPKWKISLQTHKYLNIP